MDLAKSVEKYNAGVARYREVVGTILTDRTQGASFPSASPTPDNNAISRDGGFAALSPQARQRFTRVEGAGHPFPVLRPALGGVVNAGRYVKLELTENIGRIVR
jgi:hypothetical protein